jgi:predicted amino acid dehydrogenase
VLKVKLVWRVTPEQRVMANGEVELPGDVQINCDLGLPGKVVYACLAETALLALEGRYESFTLSREISVEKVKDIYKMAIRHGVKLASITGPTGEITDQEIALCREHALRALEKRERDE